ncbi:rifamycin-inactivating phosphotransferase [Nocardia sp. AG03]|uniref:rifamycin-inactivating phosphotransferase n=1 Tax=Nocardia sp. AG03 TaxID=3025312 RepID=UPI002418B7E5|nr:rifamycin-inactivating phosphotransferase [Nocardia sp. AG03]
MSYVLDFGEVDRGRVALVGGKGANLGELARVDGVSVPAGFCVTTEAFARVLADAPELGESLAALAELAPEDRDGIATRSARIRRTIETLPVPEQVAAEIRAAHARLGVEGAYAVRSSATAEDLPTASFAGQQDTYLNVIGPAAILAHVSRCWASLFTERAVTYRLRNGFGHSAVRMAVVVQRMVSPRAAGILMTADPVTSDRRVVSVDAGFGLGEALVSGLVNADNYRVRDGVIVDRTVASKKLAVEPVPGGGTRVREIAAARREQPVLADAEVLRLAELGRRIEAHFGSPQDIEWCLDGTEIRVVQSRPITTLFPIPVAADDGNHIYISVGHQQMMTDAMKPLGISFWQLTSSAPMRDAGGRLFVDATRMLASPAARTALVRGFATSDPLIADALETVLARDGFLPELPESEAVRPPAGTVPADPDDEPDPALVQELIASSEQSLAALRAKIGTLTGPVLLEVIRDDITEFRRDLFSAQSIRLIMVAMGATQWLNDRLWEWLGEKNSADALTQSVPGNVTSEMGLALLDVADVLRPHPQVVAYLRQVEETGTTGDFLDELGALAGGPAARAALAGFLERFGMRCAGEIDITRPRWHEEPTTLVPILLGNIRNFAPGAAERRFQDGLREAERERHRLLGLLRALPDGTRKAAETDRMIGRLRAFSGYREYPKYGMVSRYSVYKQALLGEADRLVTAGVLRAPDDIYYLRYDELAEVVRTRRADPALLAERRSEFRRFQTLTAPRVLTSDGEALTGTYRRTDLPPGALAGTAVSAGTIEGRARVVTDIARADLDPGDILVTAYTDPSWTPLFVAVAGLVTEVGGLMTHGAVIAREYGLPAVVGVEHATERIRDGQRIRVHGTEGYVEILG